MMLQRISGVHLNGHLPELNQPLLQQTVRFTLLEAMTFPLEQKVKP